MTLRQTSVGAALAIMVGLAPGALAQQRTAGRDFDAEYRAAVQSAKDAAGFEFLGRHDLADVFLALTLADQSTGAGSLV